MLLSEYTQSETSGKSIWERVFGQYGQSAACMPWTAWRKKSAITLFPPGSM